VPIAVMYDGCVWVRTLEGREGFVLYPPRAGRAKVSFWGTVSTEAVAIDDLDATSRAALRETPLKRIKLD